MSAQWVAEIIGQMHINKVTSRTLADHMGLTPEYVSMVLNGHRCPKGAEERFRIALDEIISTRSPGSQSTENPVQ